MQHHLLKNARLATHRDGFVLFFFGLTALLEDCYNHKIFGVDEGQHDKTHRMNRDTRFDFDTL